MDTRSARDRHEISTNSFSHYPCSPPTLLEIVMSSEIAFGSRIRLKNIFVIFVGGHDCALVKKICKFPWRCHVTMMPGRVGGAG